MAKTDPNLQAFSDGLSAAVEQGSAFTVLVDARQRMPASGVAYAQDLVLTASHVVQREEDIRVTLPDGSQLNAELLGRDPSSDLALLRLEQAQANPAPAAAGEPRVGQIALALGRPTPEGIQASFGMVSAVGGPVQTRHGGRLDAYLRTDAIPYPGFSGGPLVDVEGNLLGINTSGLGWGASLTIPAAQAWTIAAAIEKDGGVKRGFLGLRSQFVELAAEAQKALGRKQASGLLVVALEENGPAAQGGIILGDIIVALNGEATPDHDALLAHLGHEVVGQATPIEVLRGGRPESVSVSIGERPQHEHGRHGRRRHGGKRQGRQRDDRQGNGRRGRGPRR